MEKLVNYYDILGIDFEEAKDMEAETFKETVLNHAGKANDKLNKEYEDGIITEEELETRKEEVRQAAVVLLDADLREKYDEDLAAQLEADKSKRGTKVTGEEEAPKTSKKGKTVLKVLGVVALCGLIIWGAKSCSDNNWLGRNGSTEPTTVVEQSVDPKDGYNTGTGSSADTATTGETTGETESDTETKTSETAETGESETGESETAEEETKEEETKEEETRQAVNYGDVMDQAEVTRRAQQLVKELNDAHVVNPVTTLPYTEAEIVALIQYSNGVYIPTSQEEIDILHLNLLNLLISPLNTDDYLYHIVYATGDDTFADVAQVSSENNAQHYARFDESFAAYGENGVYPLIQWITEKRIAIYSTTDREEIARIYDEVGQAMADLMKGNGATITVMENGKEVTYTFTSEQVLANHSSAVVLTTEAQLIFANHYELRNEKGEIIESGKTSWEVINKFNSNGIDDNGQPIYEPDVVTLEEIQAWINNGCDYEWAIDDVLIGGQTFGQRIQGDLEGMALNNLTMSQQQKTK